MKSDSDALYFRFCFGLNRVKSFCSYLAKHMIHALSEDETGFSKHLCERSKMSFKSRDIERYAESGRFEALEMLYSKTQGAIEWNKIFTTLCTYGELKLIKRLLRRFTVRLKAEVLLTCAEFGQIEVLRYLCDFGTAIPDQALDRAALHGHFEVAQCLVEGGNSNLMGSSLVNAVAAGSEDLCLFLVDRGANIHSVTQSTGRTVLVDAVSKNWIALTKKLINKGANILEKDGKSLVEMANDSDMLEYLLKKGAKLETKDLKYRNRNRGVYRSLMQNGIASNALFEACKNLEMCYALSEIESVAISPLLCSKALWFGVTQNNFGSSAVLGLIRKGANVYYRNEGKSALMVACESGNVGAVKCLLENKAAVNDVCDAEVAKTPLFYALNCTEETANNHPSINLLQCLLEHGADVERIGFKTLPYSTALFQAAHFRHIEAMVCLIEHVANVNAVNLFGRNALMIYQNSNVDGKQDIHNLRRFVEKAISKGLDLNAKDENGRTVWMIACERPDVSLIETYYDLGADLNVVDNNGTTCLMRACLTANLDVVKWLTEKNGDLDAQEKDGKTALMESCRAANLDVVKCLTDKNANLDARDKDGLTALIFAFSKTGSNDVLAIIEHLIVHCGVNVENVIFNGLPLICYAAFFGDVDCFRFLAEERRMHWNLTKENGLTTLMMACSKSTEGKKTKFLVDWMIRNGADELAMDCKGWTPMMYACQQKSLSTMKVLRKWRNSSLHVHKCFEVAVTTGNIEIVAHIIEEAKEMNIPQARLLFDENEKEVSFNSKVLSLMSKKEKLLNAENREENGA